MFTGSVANVHDHLIGVSRMPILVMLCPWKHIDQTCPDEQHLLRGSSVGDHSVPSIERLWKVS